MATVFRRIITPLTVVRKNWIYLLWLVGVVFIGLINIVATLLISPNEINNIFNEGMIYFSALAMFAPHIPSFLVEQNVSKKQGRKTRFFNYKTPVLLAEFLICILIPLLWAGIYRGSFTIQVIIWLSALFVVFYMYCAVEMENYEEYDAFDDDSYINGENKRMSDTEKKSKELSTMETDEGIIEV